MLKTKTMGAAGKLKPRARRASSPPSAPRPDRSVCKADCLLPAASEDGYCAEHAKLRALDKAALQREAATRMAVERAGARAELLSVTRNLIEALEVMRPGAALVKRARRLLDAARLDPL